MTPKEFNFLCEMIVANAKAGYGIRESEVMAGKPLNPQQFKMGPKSRLVLRTQLAKHLKSPI